MVPKMKSLTINEIVNIYSITTCTRFTLLKFNITSERYNDKTSVTQGWKWIKPGLGLEKMDKTLWDKDEKHHHPSKMLPF